MAEKKAYWELLRDGRWQRKRLEIMQRDGFMCMHCFKRGDDGAVLNVHHRIYRKGAMPWEYENSALITLCEACHEVNHEWRSRLTEAIAKLTDFDLERIVGYAEGMAAQDTTQNFLTPDTESNLKPGWEDVRFPISSSSHAFGFMDFMTGGDDPHGYVKRITEAGSVGFMMVLDPRWCRGSK